MNKDIKNLVDWTIHFVKHKDIMTKKLEKIYFRFNEVFAKFKDKEHVFIIEPDLKNSEGAQKKLDENPEMHLSIVSFNTEETLREMIKKWGSFVRFKNFSIYFVNPNSQTDKKWIIVPYTHNKICDEDSLELGLKSMFETVEPVNA